MRHRLVVALAAMAAVDTPVPARAGTVAVLDNDGRGWGHGVGMAQDGAFWMAKGGASTNAILGHFYPGTALGKATGQVRVTLLTSGSGDVVLAFPTGGLVRDGSSGPTSPGFPVSVGPGGSVRVWTANGRYYAQPTNPGDVHAASATPPVTIPTPTTAPPTATTTTTISAPRQSRPPLLAPVVPSPTTTTTAPPAPPATRPAASPAAAPSSSRELWAIPSSNGAVAVPARSRSYRGVVEALAAPDGLHVVNQLDVEQYLAGMGEVRDPSWPPAALRAQAVAARTYALRAMATSGSLCDDDHCQVYLGRDAEYGALNKAVADTRGQVVTYARQLADTVYSSNGGGMSATPEEGFGGRSDAFPYLRAAPYTTSNPDPWNVRVAFSDVAARFGYHGDVTSAAVTRAGPSGRAMQITLSGTAGDATVDGVDFAHDLGLKSTLFTLHAEQDAAAPPPPPAPSDDAVQSLPDAINATPDAATGAADPLGTVTASGPTRAAYAAAAAGHHGPANRQQWIVLCALVLVGVCTLAATRSEAARD
jgi:stage II sporulation protein D